MEDPYRGGKWQCNMTLWPPRTGAGRQPAEREEEPRPELRRHLGRRQQQREAECREGRHNPAAPPVGRRGQQRA
jgi:hypothetical protein